MESFSPSLPAPKYRPIYDQNTIRASPLMPPITLECMLSQEPGTSTLDRMAHVIQESGIEIAWDHISDVAASHLVEHRGLDGDFKIHDFYRPEDYKTPTDLVMVVANIEVQLGLLCASDIGCALLQQLLSIEDVRGQRVSMISADKIRDIITTSHPAPDPPYLVHMSSDSLYISWKTASWWEVYELASLDIVIRETLYALPCTAMRPQPPSA
jgi:hypothetical protein